MEYESMGKLIQTLRKEKGLTQKQLADMLKITDKAVSKWERDIACPDTIMLPKVANILGITVEELLSAKTLPTPNIYKSKISDDTNPHAYMYREQFRILLKRGIPSFILGFVLMLFFSIAIMGSQKNGIDASTILNGLLIAGISGYLFTGLPYGWTMASKLTERWIIYGNILLIMFLFGLKFILAFSIGFIFYPIVLIYNLIRSQKSKRKVRLWTIIVVTTIVLWYAFIGIYAMIDAKSNAKVNNNTDANDAAMVQTIDIDSFSDQHALIEDLCEIACNATMEKETENTINFDWTITKPTQIHGVFFLEAKDSENPHYNILENLYLTNAIVVVSGYYLNEAGPISVNQWEMDIAVYPNFIVNENYSLVYDNESMYSHNLRSDDMDALMEWLSSEYADMNIQEIEYQ